MVARTNTEMLLGSRKTRGCRATLLQFHYATLSLETKPADPFGCLSEMPIRSPVMLALPYVAVNPLWIASVAQGSVLPPDRGAVGGRVSMSLNLQKSTAPGELEAPESGNRRCFRGT